MELTILDKGIIAVDIITMSATLFCYIPTDELDRARQVAVQSDLHQIAAAGQQYLIEQNAELVPYPLLVQVEYISPLAPADDTTYDHIIIHRSGGAARAQVDGFWVTYTY